MLPGRPQGPIKGVLMMLLGSWEEEQHRQKYCQDINFVFLGCRRSYQTWRNIIKLVSLVV